jgi:hypothetical protein
MDHNYLDCPFCGSPAEVADPGIGDIGCTKCAAINHVSDWNKRKYVKKMSYVMKAGRARLGPSTELIFCNCYGEGIIIQQFDKLDDCLSFSFWSGGLKPGRVPLWWRIKGAFKYFWQNLRDGWIGPDSILLGRDGCTALRDRLDQLLSEWPSEEEVRACRDEFWKRIKEEADE